MLQLKPVVCFFLQLLLPCLIIAQPAVPVYREINVRVFDEKQHPVDFATIRLLNQKDSSQVLSVRSDSAGNATLQNIPPGTYLVSISRVNFQTTWQPAEITQSIPANGFAFSVILYKNENLQGVTVIGKKTAIQYTPDKTIIQVEASIANAGATALEVLERSPGVTIDRDGNISLKGRSQVMVMIDGKPSYLSNADLAIMLAGMSANQIESIELIDNPSARYDAAGNGGIINIRLKKSRQKGFNGNLSLSAGQGVYSKSNNSLALNYRNGKLNLFGNYSLNSLSNFVNMYALRTYLADDDKTVLSMLRQPTYFKARSNSQTLRTGVDYALSANTEIGLVLSGTILLRKGLGTGQAIWMNTSGIIDSLIDTKSRSRTDWQNGMVNFNVRHKFSQKQELTADLDWVGYSIKGNQAFQNERKDYAAYTEIYKGELPSVIHIFSFKADHKLELPKSIKLESGIKWSNTKTDNNAAYFLDQGAGWEADLARTNHFLYDENIRAAYTQAEKNIAKWSFQAGLRYEFTSYKAEQFGNSLAKDSAFSNNYGGFFPNILATWKPDSLNEFSLSFGKRIDRPPYQKLNPFVSILNKYTYQVGNPKMKPQYTHNIELTHRFRDFLTTSFSYSVTRDYFSQVFYSDSSGTVYYTEGNLGKRQVFGISVGFNKAILPAWTITSQVDLMHKKMEGFVWKKMAASITQMNISITSQIRIGKAWMAELSGYYITKSQEDIQEIIEPTGQVSMGLSRQVLKNKGSLKFSYRDIFYSQQMEGFTLFNHATEYFRLQRDSRVATIAFTYRFGKANKTPNKKRATVDEIQRVE